MVPRETTIAVVETELDGLRAYAGRHGWTVGWNPEFLRLAFDGKHPVTGTLIRIVAAVNGYRALPPAWTFEDPTTERQPEGFFPKAGQLRDGRSSIFHNSGRICAPFNLQSYKENGGHHNDWGGPVNWLQVRSAGHVRASTIGGMFAIILGHLAESPGMLP